MAGGITEIESSNNLNVENDDDKGAESSFADARSKSESNNPNYKSRLKSHIFAPKSQKSQKSKKIFFFYFFHILCKKHTVLIIFGFSPLPHL